MLSSNIVVTLSALPMEKCSSSSHVCMLVTRHGGHIGFLEGIFPRHENFMDRLFAQYIDAIFKHGDELIEKLNIAANPESSSSSDDSDDDRDNTDGTIDKVSDIVSTMATGNSPEQVMQS